MDRQISKEARAELLEALRERYRTSGKAQKTRILNEFTAVSGYHRKYATRLLGARRFRKKEGTEGPEAAMAKGRRIYDEAVREALIVLWEAGDRMCGKRLKAIVPELVGALERHGHLALDPEVRSRLLIVSPATIDRLLAPIRKQSKSRRRRRAVRKITKKIPVRTFGDWKEPPPGYLEIDFVAHCGGSMAGSFVHTLVATDVCSGWTECVPLLVREQSLVVEGLEALFRQIPFPILGIDSDNDGAFINDTLLGFCEMHGIEFTRCRAYKKNDQAWVEQKNGSIVRRLVGHDRFSGIIAAQTLAHVYQSARLHVNYFQPSFKLRDKFRSGSTFKRSYDFPATPCERVLRRPDVEEAVKKRLRSVRDRLDPLELLHAIREGQAALAQQASRTDPTEGPGRKTLEQFLAELPTYWKAGEVRPTHKETPKATSRHWRTRKDPFESVWLDVLQWLQRDPDETARGLFERLRQKHPGRFSDGQLRTLQRRLREWRQVMAKQLVYAFMKDPPGEQDAVEVRVVGDLGKEETCLEPHQNSNGD
jgi:hypothetical protein